MRYLDVIASKPINMQFLCCRGEILWRLVVQHHLCFERKREDNSTTNRVLKIPEAY